MEKKRIATKLCTGGYYKGYANAMGFAGMGQLKMPHGVVYIGEFEDGMFHGHGSLVYPNGLKVEGIWEHGINIAIQNIRFSDGLKYFQPEWKYLHGRERRFYPEYSLGLQPECSLYRTEQWPSPKLNPGTLDTGDGFYSPINKSVFDHNSKEVLRIPQEDEVKWINKNCRYGWRSTIGNQMIKENG